MRTWASGNASLIIFSISLASIAEARDKGISRGRGSVTNSENVSEQKRALMLPQELKAMGPEKEIVLYEGLAHPILCRKVRYYKESYFTRRLLPKVAVEPLRL